MEHHGTGAHRTGERATSDLVDTRDEPQPATVQVALHGHEAVEALELRAGSRESRTSRSNEIAHARPLVPIQLAQQRRQIALAADREQRADIGDRVLVSKFAYRTGGPRYGDVVVFTSPEDGKTDLIKRVIAVAGQTVDVQDGRVIVDGTTLSEPYINQDFPSHDDADAIRTVPAGTVWVMGDNRANSKDSRYIGPIAASAILGRAFAIYWPPSRIGGL